MDLFSRLQTFRLNSLDFLMTKLIDFYLFYTLTDECLYFERQALRHVRVNSASSELFNKKQVSYEIKLMIVFVCVSFLFLLKTGVIFTFLVYHFVPKCFNNYQNVKLFHNLSV